MSLNTEVLSAGVFTSGIRNSHSYIENDKGLSNNSVTPANNLRPEKNTQPLSQFPDFLSANENLMAKSVSVVGMGKFNEISNSSYFSGVGSENFDQKKKAKRKKRVYSVRKKGQCKKTLNLPSEEVNLDSDLAEIVQTIKTENSLDSDSSASTVILDDFPFLAESMSEIEGNNKQVFINSEESKLQNCQKMPITEKNVIDKGKHQESFADSSQSILNVSLSLLLNAKRELNQNKVLDNRTLGENSTNSDLQKLSATFSSHPASHPDLQRDIPLLKTVKMENVANDIAAKISPEATCGLMPSKKASDFSLLKNLLLPNAPGKLLTVTQSECPIGLYKESANTDLQTKKKTPAKRNPRTQKKLLQNINNSVSVAHSSVLSSSAKTSKDEDMTPETQSGVSNFQKEPILPHSKEKSPSVFSSNKNSDVIKCPSKNIPTDFYKSQNSMYYNFPENSVKNTYVHMDFEEAEKEKVEPNLFTSLFIKKEKIDENDIVAINDIPVSNPSEVSPSLSVTKKVIESTSEKSKLEIHKSIPDFDESEDNLPLSYFLQKFRHHGNIVTDIKKLESEISRSDSSVSCEKKKIFYKVKSLQESQHNLFKNHSQPNDSKLLEGGNNSIPVQQSDRTLFVNKQNLNSSPMKDFFSTSVSKQTKGKRSCKSAKTKTEKRSRIESNEIHANFTLDQNNVLESSSCLNYGNNVFTFSEANEKMDKLTKVKKNEFPEVSSITKNPSTLADNSLKSNEPFDSKHQNIMPLQSEVKNNTIANVHVEMSFEEDASDKNELLENMKSLLFLEVDKNKLFEKDIKIKLEPIENLPFIKTEPNLTIGCASENDRINICPEISLPAPIINSHNVLDTPTKKKATPSKKRSKTKKLTLRKKCKSTNALVHNDESIPINPGVSSKLQDDVENKIVETVPPDICSMSENTSFLQDNTKEKKSKKKKNEIAATCQESDSSVLDDLNNKIVTDDSVHTVVEQPTMSNDVTIPASKKAKISKASKRNKKNCATVQVEKSLDICSSQNDVPHSINMLNKCGRSTINSKQTLFNFLDMNALSVKNNKELISLAMDENKLMKSMPIHNAFLVETQANVTSIPVNEKESTCTDETLDIASANEKKKASANSKKKRNRKKTYWYRKKRKKSTPKKDFETDNTESNNAQIDVEKIISGDSNISDEIETSAASVIEDPIITPEASNCGSYINTSYINKSLQSIIKSNFAKFKEDNNFVPLLNTFSAQINHTSSEAGSDITGNELEINKIPSILENNANHCSKPSESRKSDVAPEVNVGSKTNETLNSCEENVRSTEPLKILIRNNTVRFLSSPDKCDKQIKKITEAQNSNLNNSNEKDLQLGQPTNNISSDNIVHDISKPLNEIEKTLLSIKKEKVDDNQSMPNAGKTIENSVCTNSLIPKTSQVSVASELNSTILTSNLNKHTLEHSEIFVDSCKTATKNINEENIVFQSLTDATNASSSLLSIKKEKVEETKTKQIQETISGSAKQINKNENFSRELFNTYSSSDLIDVSNSRESYISKSIASEPSKTTSYQNITHESIQKNPALSVPIVLSSKENSFSTDNNRTHLSEFQKTLLSIKKEKASDEQTSLQSNHSVSSLGKDETISKNFLPASATLNNSSEYLQILRSIKKEVVETDNRVECGNLNNQSEIIKSCSNFSKKDHNSQGNEQSINESVAQRNSNCFPNSDPKPSDGNISDECSEIIIVHEKRVVPKVLCSTEVEKRITVPQIMPNVAVSGSTSDGMSIKQIDPSINKTQSGSENSTKDLCNCPLPKNTDIFSKSISTPHVLKEFVQDALNGNAAYDPSFPSISPVSFPSNSLTVTSKNSSSIVVSDASENNSVNNKDSYSVDKKLKLAYADQFSRSPSFHSPASFEQPQNRDLLTPSKCITPDTKMECSFKSESDGSFVSFQYTQPKYCKNYFKYPHPAYVASSKHKFRPQSKVYNRVKISSMNLTLAEVAERLRCYEKFNYKAGNKLGDIARLKHYPLGDNEVKCYHRILGVAPSQKLLSKCFKSPEKKHSPFHQFISLNNDLQNTYNFRGYQPQADNLEFKEASQLDVKVMESNGYFNATKKDFECESTNISLNQVHNVNHIMPAPDSIEEFPQLNQLQAQHSYKTQTSGFVDQFTDSSSIDVINSEIVAKNIQWHQITNAIQTAKYMNLNNQNNSGRIHNFSEDFNLTKENIQFSLLDVENKNIGNEERLQSTPISDPSHMPLNIERNEPEQLGLKTEVGHNSITDVSKINELIQMIQKYSKDIQSQNATQPESNSHQIVDESIKINSVSKCLDSVAINLSNECSDQQTHEVADNNNVTLSSEEFNQMNDSSLNKVVTDVDLPVAELRKILETAVNLNCDISVAQDSVVCKNLTFDQQPILINCSTSKSIAECEQNNDFSTDKNASKSIPIHWDNVPSTVTDDKPQSNVSDGNKVSVSDDEQITDLPNDVESEDGAFDNEFVTNEDSCHSNSSTYQAKIMTSKDNSKFEESANEPNVDKGDSSIPQYKSKWEKIMERKALEASENKKQKISSHLLKDCFPVSAKISKNNKVSKVISKHSSKSKKLKSVKKHKSSSKEHKKSHKISKKSKFSEFKASPAFSKKHSIDSHEKHSSKHHKSKHSKSIENESLKSKNLPPSKKDKHKFKTKFVDDASDLFVPDKPVKKTHDFDRNEKTGDSNAAKCFYGNRVTNRGTFLTQSSSNQPPKVKKNSRKTFSQPKHLSVSRSEEYHSLINSPDINISINQNYVSHDFHKSKLSKFHDQESFPHHLHENKRMFSRINSLENEITISSPLENRINFADSTSSSNDAFSSITNSTRKQVFPADDNASFCKSSPVFSSLLQSPFYYPPSEGQGKDIFVETLPSTQLEENAMSAKYHSSSSNHQSMLADQNLLKLQKLFKKSKKTTNVENLTHSSVFRNQEISSEPSTAQIKRILQSLSVDSTLPFGSVPQSPQFLEETCPTPQINNQDMNCRVNSGKCICLPPKHLKSDVGRTAIDSINVLLLILEWNVDWLFQQQKNTDPPPISKSVHKVSNCYQNYDDYYNTFLPLMLLETWQRIYVSWTHLHQAHPYFCEILSYAEENHYINVECQTAFNTLDHEKSVFPEEGNIIMVKFGTKNKGGIKILGYVTNIKIRPFNSATDSKNFSNKNLKNVKDDQIHMLKLTFMGAYASEEFDRKQPIRVQVLCNIKSTLKQNDALLFVDKSPLHQNILNPLDNGLSTIILPSRNAPKSADGTKECVKEIIKGIVSPHPIPLLTIVKSLPSSNRLVVLPPLISKMKESYRTKVLLCTRTTKALAEIGLCLEDSELKLVIIGKRADTYGKLRKYLLDDLALSDINKSPNSHNLDNSIQKGCLLKEQVKPEILTKAKKTVLNECDVILCLIRNSHDELIAQTFEEKDCIAHMCCIVDEANLCTEPETLIPLMYGISKLILIGDPDVPAKVCSKSAISYDYNRSLFHRAYDLDLISD